MNNEYPYSVSTGRLKEFFERIQRMNTPERINTKVLLSLGFKSTNDRVIVSILKTLALIDAAGAPTPSWQLMRTKDKAPFVLAQKIRAAYPDLFALYPDANSRPESDVRNFIQGRSKAGERAVSAMATTFKVLCSMADFSEASESGQPSAQQYKATAQPSTSVGRASTEATPTGIPINASVGLAPQIAINLQIQLPENADADYLDSVFESMARHLLGRQVDHEDVTFVDEDDESSSEPNDEDADDTLDMTA